MVEPTLCAGCGFAQCHCNLLAKGLEQFKQASDIKPLDVTKGQKIKNTISSKLNKDKDG